jgi:hypothetical protein
LVEVVALEAARRLDSAGAEVVAAEAVLVAARVAAEWDKCFAHPEAALVVAALTEDCFAKQ